MEKLFIASLILLFKLSAVSVQAKDAFFDDQNSKNTSVLDVIADGDMKIPVPIMPDPRNIRRFMDWMEVESGGMWYSASQTGGTLFIGYGGYGADGPGVKNWVSALAGARGWNMMAAVSGPAGVYYQDKEKLKANTKLLLEIIPKLNPSRVIIAAHSSGSFVAQEFMDLLEKYEKTALLPIVSYYDLDGGPCQLCKKFARMPENKGFVFNCVSALQPGGLTSPNISAMRDCGEFFYELSANDAKCAGQWCLHGWLINRRSHLFDANAPKVKTYYNDSSIIPCDGFL